MHVNVVAPMTTDALVYTLLLEALFRSSLGIRIDVMGFLEMHLRSNPSQHLPVCNSVFIGTGDKSRTKKLAVLH